MFHYLHFSDGKPQTIQQNPKQDVVLQVIKQNILQGWPDHKEQVPQEITPCHQVRDELCAQDSIWFKADQAVT